MNSNILKNITTLSLIITIQLFLFSCDTKSIYDKDKRIENSVWNRKDTMKFNVEINDTISLHNFYINIRNSTDYKYSNIYFFIKTDFPDGNNITDTVECTLADIDGKWRGKGIGKIKDNRFLLKKGIRFLQKGVYTFEFQQAMRVKNLSGIEDIGIRIERE